MLRRREPTPEPVENEVIRCEYGTLRKKSSGLPNTIPEETPTSNPVISTISEEISTSDTITSSEIAKHFQIPYSKLTRVIKKVIPTLCEYSCEPTIKLSNKEYRGKAFISYTLNPEALFLVLTRLNTPSTREWQDSLVNKLTTSGISIDL